MSESRPGRHPPLYLIAALAKNRVIGIQNRLPWRLPEDLAHFKALTLGHPVLMGRKTYESLGRPLPGRRNIVISRGTPALPEGVLPAGSIDAALDLCAGSEAAFCIGGAELYRQCLPRADRLYLTEVDLEPVGDAWFPEFDPGLFEEIARTQGQGEKADPLRYAFVVYQRRPRG